MISVIVPAYNEESFIDKCLSSLCNQSFKGKFEAIVVDNNSTDRTKNIAKKFTKKLPLRVVSEPVQGRGAAKCRGASEAKGQIYAYLDADTVVSENWLETIEIIFADNSVVAVSGPWKIYDMPECFTKWFAQNFQWILHHLPIKIIFGHYPLNGMNMAIKASAYKQSGGINPDLNLHDDFDLARRIHFYGKIKYDRALSVETSGRRFKDGILSGIVSYNKGTLNYLLGKRADLENRR